MTATVLIGRSRNGPGVAARPYYLGDQDDSDFGRRINAPHVRQKIGDEWTALHQAFVPQRSEVVYKISRHAVRDGQIWTWFGCYSAAIFKGNNRGGTYIGAGVVCLNQLIKPKTALNYIGTVLENLQRVGGIHGEVSLSIFDIEADEVGIKREVYDLVVANSLTSGISHSAASRAYIDLSDVLGKEDFGRGLLSVAEEVQSGAGFLRFSEAIVGCSARMASSAQSSHACRIVSQLGLNEEPPYSRARRSEAPYIREEQCNNIISSDANKNKVKNDEFDLSDIDIIRSDILRIERKLDEHMDAMNKYVAGVSHESKSYGKSRAVVRIITQYPLVAATIIIVALYSFGVLFRQIR